MCGCVAEDVPRRIILTRRHTRTRTHVSSTATITARVLCFLLWTQQLSVSPYFRSFSFYSSGRFGYEQGVAYKQEIVVAINSAAVNGALSDLVSYHATADGK